MNNAILLPVGYDIVTFKKQKAKAFAVDSVALKEDGEDGINCSTGLISKWSNTALEKRHTNTSRDLNRPRQLSPVVRVNTRHMNCTKGTYLAI